MADEFSDLCTVAADYTFNHFDCWSLQPALSEYTVQVTRSRTPTTSECSTSATPQSGGTSLVSPGSGCEVPLRTVYSVWEFYTFSKSVVTISSRASKSASITTRLFDSITIPSGREKCMPGSSACQYKYIGGQCPDDYVSWLVEAGLEYETHFCCPFAENMVKRIEEVEIYSRINEESALSIGMDHTEFLYCEYTADDPTNGIFPTTPFSSRTSQAYHTMRLKPLTVIVPHSSEASPSASTATTASPGTTPFPTATGEATPPSNKGLSTPSKIGIGVGVGLGGILLAAIVIFFLMRRSRNRKQEANTYQGKPELDAQEKRRSMLKFAHEAQDGRVHELENTGEGVGGPRVAEMEDTGLPAEADRISIIPAGESGK